MTLTKHSNIQFHTFWFFISCLPFSPSLSPTSLCHFNMEETAHSATEGCKPTNWGVDTAVLLASWPPPSNIQQLNFVCLPFVLLFPFVISSFSFAKPAFRLEFFWKSNYLCFCSDISPAQLHLKVRSWALGFPKTFKTKQKKTSPTFGKLFSHNFNVSSWLTSFTPVK